MVPVVQLLAGREPHQARLEHVGGRARRNQVNVLVGIGRKLKSNLLVHRPLARFDGSPKPTRTCLEPSMPRDPQAMGGFAVPESRQLPILQALFARNKIL